VTTSQKETLLNFAKRNKNSRCFIWLNLAKDKDLDVQELLKAYSLNAMQTMYSRHLNKPTLEVEGIAPKNWTPEKESALMAGLTKFKTGFMVQRCTKIKDDNRIYWTNNAVDSLRQKAVILENKNI